MRDIAELNDLSLSRSFTKEHMEQHVATAGEVVRTTPTPDVRPYPRG